MVEAAGIEGATPSHSTPRNVDASGAEPQQSSGTTEACAERTSLPRHTSLTLQEQTQSTSGGVSCGACVARENGDRELLHVVDAWRHLPRNAREEIVVIAQTAYDKSRRDYQVSCAGGAAPSCAPAGGFWQTSALGTTSALP